MILHVLVRDLLIFVVGVWFFEFWLDVRLPDENNLLLFFVAIPIIWATMMQMWTAISYREQKSRALYWACHMLGVLLLSCSVFLISAVLNTIETSLDPTGNILFHGVGWSAILSIIFYDVVDIARMEHADRD
jgi:Ni/Fe-hydrogenase subunit HybB-like protein